MSENNALDNLKEDLVQLEKDIAQYYAGNLDVPWSIVRLSLDNFSETIPSALVKLTEVESRITLFEDCFHRALSLWQTNHPEANYWPDGVKNFVWILDQLEKAAKVIAPFAKLTEWFTSHSPRYSISRDDIYNAFHWMETYNGQKSQPPQDIRQNKD